MTFNPSLNNISIKGVGLALSLLTIASPWSALRALAESTAPGAEVAQTTSTPAPAPSPAAPATPAPSPATPAPPSSTQNPAASPAPTPSPAAPATPAPAAPAPAAPRQSAPPAQTAPAQGGFTPAPPGQAAPRGTSQAAPRATTALTERTDYIGACRRTNRSVEVFRDTALSAVNRVGTFGPGTEVKLTGVVGNGVAQVYWPTTWPPTGTISVVGWINSAYLATCDVPIELRACYRVNADLAVRTQPSVTAGTRGYAVAGTVVYATSNPPREQTSPSSSPNFGRVWTEIAFQGSPGWVSRTGQYGAGNNMTRLPDTQCGS